MELLLKIAKINDTKYLLLNKEAKDKIKDFLKKDVDFIKFLRVKVIEACDDDSDPIKSYRCLDCNHYFDQAEIIPYCPICGKEDTIKECLELKGGKEE